MSSDFTFRDVCMEHLMKIDLNDMGHKTWYVRKRQSEKHLLPLIGEIPLDKLDYKSCLEALKTLKLNGMADKTIGFYWTIIRRTLKYAVECGYIKNPGFLEKTISGTIKAVSEFSESERKEDGRNNSLPEADKFKGIIITRHTSVLVLLVFLYNERENRSHHKVTWAVIRAIYAIVSAEVLDKALADINRYDIAKICSEIRTSDYSENYARVMLYYIKFAMEYAYENGLSDKSFNDAFRMSGGYKYSAFHFTDDEYNRINEEIGNSEYVNLYILTDTIGISRCEVLALKKDAYDPAEKTLVIEYALCYQQEKGKTVIIPPEERAKFTKRKIELPEKAWRAIENELDRTEGKKASAGKRWDDSRNYLFTDKYGDTISLNKLAIDIEKIKDKTGVRTFCLNNLKKNCIYRMIINGIPVIQIKDYLGYKSLDSVLEIYDVFSHNTGWREDVV